MAYQSVDRPPLFEEGLREDVLSTWREQGMPFGSNPRDLFTFDLRDEIEPELDPIPEMESWAENRETLTALEKRLNASDKSRLPLDWESQLHNSKDHQHVIMLRVHRGFFQSLGVQGWQRFAEVIALVKDNPSFARQILEIQANFNARITDRILRHVEVDAAIFSEPIGDNKGPLISPVMYTNLVLPTYQPILDVLQKHNVQTIILRTYANARRLISAFLKAGFNCLWAVEVNAQEMDYRLLRKEFGRDLRLIGGIDLDVLRGGPLAIHAEIEGKVPVLLTEGGYIPLADGRVRSDVSWDNYCFYRKTLAEVVDLHSGVI